MEYLSFGIVNITRRRLAQYNETVDRVKSLLTVERKELSSSVGLLGFGAIVVEGVAPHLARSRRATHNDGLWVLDKRSKHEAMAQRHWLIRDLDQAMRIFNMNIGRAFEVIPWSFDGITAYECITDANRVTKQGKYCGFGGYVVLPGCIKYWHYQFDPEFPQIVPVHIPERLAPEITIAVVPELRHCAILQRVDNMAAVYAMQTQRSRDPRFQEIELCHSMRVDRRSIQSETKWIDTKSNLWADLISRGRIEQFKEEARRAGATNLIEIDIAALNIPADLPAMLQRLIDITRLIPRNIRSRDRL